MEQQLHTMLKYLPANQRKQLAKCLPAPARKRSPGRARKFTPEQVEQLITDYEHGLTLIQIGEKNGVAGATVRRYLTEAGVQMRPRGPWRVPDGSKRYEVVNLVSQGKKQSDVAKSLGISKQRVSQILKRWF